MITASQPFETGSETKGLKEIITLARKAVIKNPKLKTQHSNSLSYYYSRNIISPDREGLLKNLIGLQRCTLTFKNALAQILILMNTEVPLPLSINRKCPK